MIIYKKISTRSRYTGDPPYFWGKFLVENGEIYFIAGAWEYKDLKNQNTDKFKILANSKGFRKSTGTVFFEWYIPQ